ncbi:MAG: CYTH domain-containing protein [Chloroflexi bacterium]|nr:MAG: CYTH domain-containing protein [Chloroflexota bacterium]
MRNLELKASCADLEAGEQVAQRLGATLAGEWRQADTYLWIGYERPESDATRWSQYEIAPVADSRALLSILAKALGVRVRVEKSRRVYLYRGARIHLDRVASLGTFVEFEVPCNDGDERLAREIMRELSEAFGWHADDALRASYADLLENRP